MRVLPHVTAQIGRRRNPSAVTVVKDLRRPHAVNVKYSSTDSSLAYTPSQTKNNRPPLLTLHQARLGFINTNKSQTPPITLDIQHPTQGGHVILGRNGSGKSLLGTVLSSTNTTTASSTTTPSEYIQQGSLQLLNGDTRSHHIPKHSHQTFTAHVSFQSHQDLLQRGGTVWHAISSSSPLSLPPDKAGTTTTSATSGGGGNLSKAAQFLVVRWGLFPLLHQDVRTLSTGQIRKVLLVSALAKRPKLLILDNAFDGLDGPSRNALRALVSKTLKGFRQDILVQAVDSRATAHTQVVLITHRAEEIVDECQFVTYMQHQPQFSTSLPRSTTSPTSSSTDTSNHNNNNADDAIRTEPRNGQSGDDILRNALLLQGGDTTHLSTSMDWENHDPTLPSTTDITAWWNMERAATTPNQSTSSQQPIVQMSHLSIGHGDATLLQDLNWTVSAGDHWLVAGGNGAGKSTLSRFLARGTGASPSPSSSTLLTSSSGTMTLNTTARSSNSTDTIGWVATELHIAMSRSPRMVRDVVTSDGKVAIDVATFVTRNLDLNDQLMDRPFSQLSQGEQKLVLIASAIATRPQLLVLDEPCQGLDLLNRRRVLGLVERLCQANDMNLVYITHHMEEWIPSITHVLHLVNGTAAYNGPRSHYNPDLF